MSKTKKEEVNGGRLFLIIGKSLSGKDTLLNEILESESFCKDMKLERLVRLTTRKPREDEVDGKTYHFITDKEYEAKYKDNKKAIVTTFNSKYGKLYYITDLSAMDPNHNYIMAADPESIAPCKKILKDKLCIIYLIPPTYLLLERFVKRNENDEYASKRYSEFYRRLIDDLVKFSKSDSFINNTTCIINVGREVKLRTIKSKMKEFINDNTISTILNSKKNFEFENKHRHATLFSFKDVVDNQIKLCDGKIIIYTEEEKYETSLEEY